MAQKITISGKNGYVILYGFAMDNSVRAYFIGNRNLERVDEKVKELQGFGAYMICVFYTDEFHGFN
jgi:hypothetical protein